MDTKALRQKILDLAIRGKLVPQDPNDEPASVLLERIREQKQQMVKEGKLKKKDIKNDSVIFVGEDNLHYEKFADGSVKCIEDEIPFELPDGWRWARLNQIYNFIDYRGATPNKISAGVPLITAKNVKSGYIDYSVDEYISEEEYWERQQRGTSRLGDILFTTEAPLGNAAIANIDKFSAGQRLITFQHYGNCTLNNTTFLYFILSDIFQNQLHTRKTGSTVAGIKASILKTLVLPVPPLKEQEKIYNACRNLLTLTGKITSDKQDILSIISKTKSKILDLAIRGQLVPQNPDDEPASVLLERIRAEKEELIKQGKIKRDKKESIIFKGEDNSYYEKIGTEIRCIDSEISFEIPGGWSYERLGNICSVARGGSPRPIENYLTDDKNGLNWIKIGDTEQGGKYIFSTKEKIRPDGLSKTRYVHCGDFLLTNSMSFGRPYILKTDGCIHDGWLVIGEVENVFNQDFLYYLLSSSAMYNALSLLAAGSTVKNLKSDSVKSLIVPIPPIEEQKNISIQVETLLMIIAHVEQNLN